MTDVALPDLVAEQDLVLTSRQAVAMFGKGKVRAQLDARRWSRPAHDVVVLHNGPPTPAQRNWIALFACAPGSVLGGLSALQEDGLTGFGRAMPTVIQPMGSRRPAYDDVRTHWSTQLSAEDVHPLRRPARTRAARSIVDAASWQTNPRYARAIILAGVQQRLVSPAQLHDVVRRRGNLRHRAIIGESIHDALGGKQSLPERDFDVIRARIRAPTPTRQSVCRGRAGRYYLDLEWPEYGTACEVHGIPHMYVANWSKDLIRANEVAIAGPRLLVFSSYAIRHQYRLVADQLTRMLRRGGWR